MPGKHMAPAPKPSEDTGGRRFKTTEGTGGSRFRTEEGSGGARFRTEEESGRSRFATSGSGGRRFRTTESTGSRFSTVESGSRFDTTDDEISEITPEKPKKKGGFRRALSTLLIIVGIGLLLVAGGMWGYARFRYWRQDQMNKKLAEHVKIVEVTEAEEECPIEVDWESLKAVNDDVVGWIYVPGTVVNYPVYQGVDNDQYLRTNALGEWSVGGQVFLDWENTAPGMMDYQSILYGHHLYDGTMFQPLSLLDDQAVFDATDTIWYLTEENSYKLEPLFMYYVEPTDETVRQFRFSSVEEFRSYLAGQLAKSVTRRADADVLVTQANRVLTMSTCNYYDGYGRSILVAIEQNPEAFVVTPTPTKTTDTETTDVEATTDAEATVDEEATGN